ncbi:MAG: arginine--tRNA ligase [Parcubacteria group bacterium]|nr:arginine--tRNA ligase [Parcubacteria group bacterium]
MGKWDNIEINMITRDLERLVLEAVKNLRQSVEAVVFERPQLAEHGDYSTNIAFALGQKLSRSPREVAEFMVSAMNSKIDKKSSIEKVEVAGPGFINFFLSKKYLFNELREVLKKKEAYGKNSGWKGKKVMVEFTDPNPFKEFHIGHLYSNIVGESLSRLFEAQGAEVRRVNYQGDAGLHVAKAIWGMQQQGISLQEMENRTLQERAKFLGQSYAAGSIAYGKDQEARQEIDALNVKIFAQDASVREMYEKGKKWSLEYFETIYQRLGTKFSAYYFESKVGKVGLGIIEKGLKKGIFKKSQGAVVFPGEKYGLHTRVFVSAQGLPTYEAKELGLAPIKYKDFKYDLSVIVTGSEVIDYFRVLLKVLEQTSPDLAQKTRHVAHGMVRLPEGKMSSRTGNVMTAEGLIEGVKDRVSQLVNSQGSKIPEQEKEGAEESIALGAIKYSFLKGNLGKDIIFDVEKSLSLDGDSGPYLQYTYARCKSILRKSKIQSPKSKTTYTNFSKEEMDILRHIQKFPEIVQEAVEKLAPNAVVNSALNLAQKYNFFYNTHPVLKAETEEQKNLRLLLTAATAQSIQNSLHLLGIKTPERM